MKSIARALITVLTLAITSLAANAQESLPPVSPTATATLKKIVALPSVQKAMMAIMRDDELTLKDQIEITEIPAPPFKESVRAADLLRRFKALGMREAHRDAEGNVIAVRKGRSLDGRPRLVLAAHLDTVFPEGTDVKVKKKNDRYYAPGIIDDARGLAALLQVLRTMNEMQIETVGDVVFVANVGEEELGDLRGVKAIFQADKSIDGFISIDGSAVWRIVNAATGSRRFKITFNGPGGHSFGAFGLPSAIHAMGRAISKIADTQTLKEPKTTFTVGTVNGGTSVNAIAADAALGLDMRSDSAAELAKLEAHMKGLVQQAVDEENARWNIKPGPNAVRAEFSVVGDRPAGSQPVISPVVMVARAAIGVMGIEVKAIQASSTDANLPIALGIPAATLGGGGAGSGSHSPGEWYMPIKAYDGPQSVMLTVLGLVGVVGAAGASEPLLPVRTTIKIAQ